MRRFAFLALLSTFLALPALATEVKVPYTKCDGSKGQRTVNCPDPEVVTVVKEVQVPGPERVVTVTKEVPVPGPVQYVEKVVTVEVEAQPKGRFIFGGGPLYTRDKADDHEWGATVVVGHQWPNGIQFLVGPTWTPASDVSGFVTAPGCEGQPAQVPYNIEGRGPWGAQALVLFAF